MQSPRLQKRIAHLLLIVGAAVGLGATEVPYGHPDFYPSPTRPAGLQGDGSGQFPGASPVIEWDFTTRKNIVWSTVLPSFGFSSPIVVGDKIFVTAEFNLLVCLDARSGEILWVRDCDTIEQVAGAEADEVREQWNGLWKTHAEGYAVCYEITFLRWKLAAIEAAKKGEKLVYPGSEKRGNDGGFGPYKDKKGRMAVWMPGGCITDEELARVQAELGKTDEAEIAAARERLAELEKLREEKAYAPSTSAYVPVGSPHKRGSEQGKAFEKKWKDVQNELQDKYGLVLEFWNGWLNAFPTPISDGEHVWAQFFHSQVACFDLEGERKWMEVFVDDPKKAGLSLGQNYCPSPILAGDRLLTIFGGDRGSRQVIRCMDKATGELIWQREDFELNGRHSFNQIRRIHTDEVDAIISGSGLILATEDGKPISELKPFMHQIPPPIVHGDTAFMFAGGGMTGGRENGAYAVRVVRDDGQMKAEYLWANVPKVLRKGKKERPSHSWKVLGAVVPEGKMVDNAENQPASAVGGIVHDGKIWFINKGMTFDVEDGTMERFDVEGAKRVQSQGHEIRAGDYLITSGHQSDVALYGVFPLEDPTRCLQMNRLGSEVHRRVQLLEMPIEEVLEMVRQHHYDMKPGLMNHSTPWAQGNRLYCRTRDSLYCIGDPGAPYHSPKGAPAAAKTE